MITPSDVFVLTGNHDPTNTQTLYSPGQIIAIPAR
jgi:DNA repair exonuclease SbcCD nuclease subunit